MICVGEEASAGYFAARERALRYPPKFSAQMASVGYSTVSDCTSRYPFQIFSSVNICRILGILYPAQTTLVGYF